VENLKQFAGQVVVVTGASRGIGQGIAQRFAREGASLVVSANEDRVHEVGLPDTRRVLIGAGGVHAAGAEFRRFFGDIRAVLVADENTYAAAGRDAWRALQAEGRVAGEPIVWPGRPAPYADFESVLALESALRGRDAIPVAVGSGTINDLTKLASHRLGRPYMVVATAASMDGYAAFGAAITCDGVKRTLPCPAPRVVVADLDVLAEAPPAMTAAGYADLLAKVSAGADWLLADAVGAEPLNQRAWTLVQGSLRARIACPERVRAGDRQALESLMEGLVVTGLAMQECRSSRPASGSEHLFSHLWEMEALQAGHEGFSHGFKVGIGAIAAAALYERLLARDFGSLDIDSAASAWPRRAEVEATVRRLYGDMPDAGRIAEQSLAKYLDDRALVARLAATKRAWPEISLRLRDQVLPAAKVRDLLHKAGCPVEPEAIGVDRAHLRATCERARHLRARYTQLDFLAETNELARCLAELFESGGGLG
jgi:glycerol-1-phosphate dehydrogenase [NAD(P)+]